METRFLTQPNIELARTLKEHLSNHEVALIAIAYITEDGIKEIEKELLQKRSVKIVCGVHGCISDLPALKNLVSRSNKIIDGRVFLGTNVFHPKLYVFQRNDSTALLVGSSNLTGSGLHSNEEAIVEIIGPPLSRPIVDAITYFESLWNTNSVSVDKYLHEHPNYSVKHSQNESLTSEQKQKLDLIKKELLSKSTVVFKNRVNKTFYNEGKQTLPTQFNSLIYSYNLCALHRSVPFDIILPNGETVQGQMYYGANTTGYYYQFKISGSDNVMKLQRQISINNNLEHNINLSTRIVRINRT
ncbi:MAG: phospholipase D family protein [Nitrospirota bacterium]|jgi:HKD family nuclease